MPFFTWFHLHTFIKVKVVIRLSFMTLSFISIVYRQYVGNVQTGGGSISCLVLSLRRYKTCFYFNSASKKGGGSQKGRVEGLTLKLFMRKSKPLRIVLPDA